MNKQESKLCAFKNCMSMFMTRGYLIDSDFYENVMNLTIADYIMHENKYNIINDKISYKYMDRVFNVHLIFNDNSNDSIAIGNIVDSIVSKLGGMNVTRHNPLHTLKCFDDHNVHYTIIVYNDSSNMNKKILEEQTPIGLEIFSVKELNVNIISHIYQPKFTVENPNNHTKDNIKKYGRMCQNDPVVKYYNAKPKDIFKIERENEKGVAHVYKVVISSNINYEHPTKK
jgi:DNA-directed RNA polymerase subunit H (RpoH/RPB5)